MPLLLHALYYHLIDEPNSTRTYSAIATACSLSFEDASFVLTTFITPVRQFRFKRLPFGITCASQIFQRKMEEILAGIRGVEIYQDDILVHAPTIKHHVQIMLPVLERLKKAGVKLNQEKCEL